MTDRSKLLALAEECDGRAIRCAQMATSARLGGTSSVSWISESAHYATVAAALRAQAEALA